MRSIADCDLTPWLNYFVSTLAQAADRLHHRARSLQVQQGRPSAPWDQLSRRQQQVLTRLLARKLSDENASFFIRSADIETWFAVSDRTAREWLAHWSQAGFLLPASSGAGARTHRYDLAQDWKVILEQAKTILPNNGS